MSHPWWAGAAPAEATLRCGPNRHRVRWEDGRLLALDHPDPGEEAVISALGDDEPVCLAVQRAWKAHSSDPRVLLLGARHPGDPVVVSPAELEAARAELARRRDGHPAGAPAPDRGRLLAWAEEDFSLLSLLALDPAVQRRLQHEVAANLARAGGEGTALEAATVGRLLPVLRRWAGPGRRLSVSLGPPGVSLAGGGLAVTVGADWLADVWGPYLPVVDGFLVLAVHRNDGRTASVTAVSSPGAPARRLVAAGPAPWRMTGEEEA